MEGFVKRGLLILFLFLIYFIFYPKIKKNSHPVPERKTELTYENRNQEERTFINNPENMYVTIAKSLNLRNSPSLNAPIIDKLPCLTLVASNEASKGWRKVVVLKKINQNLTGWVSEKYIIPLAAILESTSPYDKPKLKKEIEALPQIADVKLIKWREKSVPYLHTYLVKIVNHSCIPIKNLKIEVIEYSDEKTEVFRDIETLRTNIPPNDWKRIKFQVLGDEDAKLASVRLVSFECGW